MKRPRVNRQAVVGTVLEYVWMIFGMFIYSFGWLACIMPANTLGGGAAGLSLLFYHITGLPIGMLTLIVNGVLLLIGGTIVGWNFGMKTIFCIAMLSVTMSVLQPLLAAVTPAGETLLPSTAGQRRSSRSIPSATASCWSSWAASSPASASPSASGRAARRAARTSSP